MAHLKFDMAKLEKLNDPARLESLPPGVFWHALDEPAGARVIVEIGAGTGLFAAEFAKRAPSAVIYAADTAPQMLDWMREHRPEVSEGRIVPVLATETSVPLEDGVADALYMINLHHELADPGSTYAEAHRLLGPGGLLLVVDWKHAETPKGPPLEVRATTEQLISALESAGFADITAHDALEWHELLTAAKR